MSWPSDAAARFFAAAGVERFASTGISKEKCRNRVGSAAALPFVQGLLHGLNELTGRPLPRGRLFELCAR
jgi:hypothetical protein